MLKHNGKVLLNSQQRVPGPEPQQFGRITGVLGPFLDGVLVDPLTSLHVACRAKGDALYVLQLLHQVKWPFLISVRNVVLRSDSQLSVLPPDREPIEAATKRY